MIPLNTPIQPSSHAGEALHFRAGDFALDSYLWRSSHRSIWIPFIASEIPDNGDFSSLVLFLRLSGYIVNVPTPFSSMERILRKWGFVHTTKLHEGHNISVFTSPRMSNKIKVDQSGEELDGFVSDPVEGWERTQYGYVPNMTETQVLSKVMNVFLEARKL